MPELPEVETVVRSVRPYVAGRQILDAKFTSKWVTPGNRAALAKKLIGRRIESVTRRGKFIVMALDDGSSLTIHLGMTGKLLVSGRPAEHVYGEFTLDAPAGGLLGEAELLYHDPRQFGTIEWSPEPLHPRVARLGPEPLEIPFDEFRARLKRRARIKALLLNQTFLAGLGNIYADESLYRAGIHPLASAEKIGPKRARRLFDAIRGVLSQAIELGGSSISDYVNADGERGWFQVQHKAYGREGQPCEGCGRPIRKILVAQRGTHYCPACQKK